MKFNLKNTFKKLSKKTQKTGENIIGASQIKESGSFILKTYENLTQKRNVRHETFVNACYRLKLTSKDLEDSYKYYAGRFYVFFVFQWIAIFTLLYFLWKGQFSALAIISFILIIQSQLMISSFRCAQIREKNLFSFMHWVKNPNKWWVSKLEKNNKKTVTK